MKPRITLITLTVDDLERSVRFYRDGFSWPTDGIIGSEYENGAVAFFELEPGLKLALWPRSSMVSDTGLPLGTPNPTECLIAHNVASKEAVDEALETVLAAGGTILKPASDTFWGGYAGYFQDPDGHVWEVAWNPKWPVEE